MFRKIAFTAVVAMGSFALADAKDDLTAAAKKLTDASNYSWKTTMESGQFNSGQEGKTEKDGFTLINIQFGDNTIQTAMKGKKAAIKLEDAWKTTEELAGDDQGPGRFLAPMIAAFKTPGVQAEEYASKLKDVKKDGDVYTSELSGADAAALAPRRGGRRGGGGAGGQPPQMQNAKLSVKITVKDGVITKYSSHVTGTINVNGEDRDIDTTTTTDISDVGSTKVEVPADVKKKLE